MASGAGRAPSLTSSMPIINKTHIIVKRDVMLPTCWPHNHLLLIKLNICGVC